MFDEPNEPLSEHASDPSLRAREKAEELHLHTELAAVFEGPAKFEAEVCPGLDPELARDLQRRVARLEKLKSADSPVLPPAGAGEAADVLGLARVRSLASNDYHLYRRPGEVMMARWLEGEQVDTFYQRMQAHFDAALNGYREDQRAAHGWKSDPATLAYLAALDAIEGRVADRYLREILRTHGVFVLSTLAVDEMDILHLSDTLMRVGAQEVVGAHSAPASEPTEQERAWFFKLFALRGMSQGVEQMCFFTYLQKSDDLMSGD